MASTYRIERWSKGDVWTTKKTGLTLAEAERLVALAKLDWRGYLWTLRIVEETPAPTAHAAEVAAGIALDARVTRAAVQGADWTWTPQGDGSFIVETKPGNAYCCSPTFCTCPDHEFRGSKTGVPCKHTIALLTKNLIEGREPEAPLYPMSPADLARPVRFDREAVAA